jgi:hypothetical protein
LSENLFADAEDIPQVIHQLVGLSSVCWDSPPTGVFDTAQAAKAAIHALNRLNELGCGVDEIRPALRDALASWDDADG